MDSEKLIPLLHYGEDVEYVPLLELFFVEEYKSLCRKEHIRHLGLYEFQNNFKFPLLISTQIFNSLDKKRTGYLTKDSYVKYFMVVYSGSIELRLMNLFSFLEYQQEGFFYKEDMAVLFRVIFTSVLHGKDQGNYNVIFVDQIIESFFRYTYDKSKCISYDEFRNIIINDDSSLFLLYYYSMDYYKTFNKDCLEYFKLNKVSLSKKSKTAMIYSNILFQGRNDYRSSTDTKVIQFPMLNNNSAFNCFLSKVISYVKQPTQIIIDFFNSIDLPSKDDEKEEDIMSELDELELFENEVISAKSSYKEEGFLQRNNVTLSSLSGLVLTESNKSLCTMTTGNGMNQFSTNNNTLTINKEQESPKDYDYQSKGLSFSPPSKFLNDNSGSGGDVYDFSPRETSRFSPLKISFPSYFIEDEIMIKKEDSFSKYRICLLNDHIFISKWKQKLNRYSYTRILPIIHSFIIDNDINDQEGDYYPQDMLSMLYYPIKQFTFYFLSKDSKVRFIKFINERNNHRKMEDYYTKTELIGTGHFSQVYLGYNKKTGNKVAIKIITRTDNIRDIDVLRWELDITIFNQLNPHQNILKSIDVFQSIKNVHIIMEYIPLGSLTTYLGKTEQCLPSATVEHILIQLINTLKHLEHYGIIHRDIKAENIMIQCDTANDKLISPKIGDFGLSQMTIPSEKRKEFYGTLLFTAPEILKKSEYDSRVDVWSLGILTYYLEFTFLPFKIKYNQEQTEVATAILTNNLSIPNKYFTGQKEAMIHKRIRTFIQLALQKDYENRPKISNINYEAGTKKVC